MKEKMNGYIKKFQTWRWKRTRSCGNSISRGLQSPFRQDRKISFLIQLSEETSYEGGDVLLHNHATPVYLSKERGTTLIFPSWLLNGTTPITKETKRTLYGWVSGPPFA